MKHRGFILVAVLIVVMLASMVVVSLLFRMHAEETATVAGAGSEQAWATAMTGISEAMQVVAKTAPGNMEWQDNPALFRERMVLDDGADRWYFTVYTPGETDRDEVRFGLTDEAGKLNLNEATEEMLGKLPKMTPYLVQGLLDFLDQDNIPRPEGAEQEYYDGLPTPYGALNGPLATLDEILLVRGFTPALLYGEDANWNFHLDPNEDDGDAQFPPDNKDGKLDLGLREYLTVSTYDLNQDNSGAPRIDLNDTTTNLTTKSSSSAEELPAGPLAYIEALHRNHISLEEPAELLEAKGKFKTESGGEVEMESGVGKAELPVLMDHYTTRKEYRLLGLVNINTASSRVLQTLPGVDEALADSIVSARRNLRPEQRRTPAWLYQEGLLDAGQLKKLAPYLTARSFQFHFHVLGYGVPSGRYRVLEAIIDTAGPKPVIQYLRDLTRQGLPFRVENGAESESSAPRIQTSSQPGPLSKRVPSRAIHAAKYG